MKKLSTLLIAIFTAIAAQAYDVVVDGIAYNLNGSEAEVTNHSSGSSNGDYYIGDITIPSSIEYDGNKYDVTAIGMRAFYGCKSLTSISIPNSITSIGTYAFYNCSILTSIKIPESVTTIGLYSFSRCTDLGSINIPNGVTTIGSYAFSECGNLTSIQLPNSVTTIGSSAFYKCVNLDSIIIPEGVTTISKYTFSNCDKLLSVQLPNSVTTIDDQAFYACKSLSSFNIPEGVTSIGYMAFTACFNLNYVTIPNSTELIGDRAFLNPDLIITFKGEEPPTFGGLINCYVANVPAESLDEYRTALSFLNPYDVITAKTTTFEIKTSALDNAAGIFSKIGEENTNNVVNLKIEGSINSYDVIFIRKMLHLRSLDLSEASIVACDYPYYDNCKTSNNVIGESFLYNMTQIQELKLPQNITEIDKNAFSKTNIQSIILPERLERIGFFAFEGCESLSKVSFNPNLKEIKSCAFQYCINLNSISLPTSLETIGNSAFLGCGNLTEVKIPESIRSIGDGAFSGCNLNDVYVWTVIPTSINQNTFDADTYQSATLHVPETSYQNYYWNTQWSQFQNLTYFNEPYTYFYIADDDLIVDENTPRLPGDPDADINGGGGLVVDGDENQGLGDVNLDADGENSGSIIGGDSGTTESGSNINMNNLAIRIPVQANRWYFFCFPFDFSRDNISYDGLSVWRWYDGQHRAEHHGDAWKNFDGDTFSKWHGYIFQGTKSGMLVINIPKAAIGGKRSIVELVKSWSEQVRDANWNLIGNPYTSFFDMQGMELDSPVTVWDGSKYQAYSPWDDDYTFYPFQAFFTQGEGKCEFDPDYRQTSKQHQNKGNRVARRSAERRINRAPALDRLVVNLELTDGSETDRTRVVFNESSKASYEQSLDAAKFTVADVPQLYSLDMSGNVYAINERPTGDGFVRLGFSVPAAGEYIINAVRSDCNMILRDLSTGKEVEISSESYTFSAKAGQDNDRFLLVKKDQTGINSVEAEKDAENVDLYNLRGIRVDNNDAPAGVYITSDGQKLIR